MVKKGLRIGSSAGSGQQRLALLRQPSHHGALVSGCSLVPEHMYGRRITGQDPEPGSQVVAEGGLPNLDPHVAGGEDGADVEDADRFRHGRREIVVRRAGVESNAENAGALPGPNLADVSQFRSQIGMAGMAKAWSKDGKSFVRLNMHQVMFSFKGRIGRATYLGGYLLNLLIGGIILGLGIASFKAPPMLGPGVIMCAIGGIGAAWCGLALQVKRLHDLGFQGANVIWFALLGPAASAAYQVFPPVALILGFASIAATVWLFAWSGSDKPNKYGPPVST
jgi:uncharacterized membrane protein YhaH (DUF805 family)